MALTAEDKLRIRREVARQLPEVRHTKDQVGAALQAIEDWFASPAILNQIRGQANAATSPFTWTNDEVDLLVDLYFRERGGG